MTSLTMAYGSTILQLYSSNNGHSFPFSLQGLTKSCCISDSCSLGDFVDGPCLAVGQWDYPGAQGYGYLTCDCGESNVALNYICESVGENYVTQPLFDASR